MFDACGREHGALWVSESSRICVAYFQLMHLFQFAILAYFQVCIYVRYWCCHLWEFCLMDGHQMPPIVQMTFTKKSISAVINNSANEMISAVYLKNRRKQMVYSQDNPNQCSLGNPPGVEFIGKSSWGLKFCVEKLKKKTPRSPHWEVPLRQMLCLRSPAYILGNL